MEINTHSDLEVAGSPENNDKYLGYGSTIRSLPNTPSVPAPSYEDSMKKPSRKSSWIFPALLAALIATIVTGGAVGGGVGASLASCKSDLE